MLKKVLLMAMFVVLTAQYAYAAPDRAGKMDIGLNVSGVIPDADEVDGTVYVGGTAAYGVTNWLALGVESGWAQFDESDSGIELEETAIPLLGDIIVRVPLEESPVQPYAIVGLGVIFWDVDDNVANLEADVDTAFAAKFGIGLDWFINSNWILNFEGSYLTSDADVTVRNTTTGASVSGEGQTDYWMIGGGLKYLFS